MSNRKLQPGGLSRPDKPAPRLSDAEERRRSQPPAEEKAQKAQKPRENKVIQPEADK